MVESATVAEIYADRDENIVFSPRKTRASESFRRRFEELLVELHRMMLNVRTDGSWKQAQGEVGCPLSDNRLFKFILEPLQAP